MNTNLLKAKVIANGMSVNSMCKIMNMSRSAFYRKTNGLSEFTQGEIDQMIRILNLSHDEIIAIFFTKQVS